MASHGLGALSSPGDVDGSALAPDITSHSGATFYLHFESGLHPLPRPARATAPIPIPAQPAAYGHRGLAAVQNQTMSARLRDEEANSRDL